MLQSTFKKTKASQKLCATCLLDKQHSNGFHQMILMDS